MKVMSVVLAIFITSWSWAEDLRQPVFFNVQDRELKVSGPQIRYHLKEKGKKLELGDLVFNNESLSVKLEGGVLIVNWDQNLVVDGDLFIINQLGKELWRQQVKGPGAWTFHEILEPEGPRWQDGEKFRFCLRSEIGRGYSSLCTQWHAIQIRETGLTLGFTKSSAQPRVILQGQEKKLSAIEDISLGGPVSFFATLKTNASYEFVSEPIMPVFRDMIQGEDLSKVTLTAELPRPLLLESKTLLRGTESFWQADLPVNQASIMLPGKSGGSFFYSLNIFNPPPRALRKFISKRTHLGTYAAQDRMIVEDSEGKEFIWDYQAPKQFALNRAELELPGESHKYLISQEVYRGGAGEASLRLTGVAAKEGELVAFGEGHISWWFNDLLGWQSDYFSRQRWGVSAKYFASFSKVPVSDEEVTAAVSISALDLDLRYRLTPGLWERDGTVGLIAGYEVVDFGGDRIPKMGVGAYWARSMPSMFDNLFNRFSILNFPKWVDMEFVKYLTSTDSDISLGDDYVLNFHGKIMWTPQFFGELGFGVKNYYFTHESTGDGASLITIYGTMGLGLNF